MLSILSHRKARDKSTDRVTPAIWAVLVAALVVVLPAWLVFLPVCFVAVVAKTEWDDLVTWKLGLRWRWPVDRYLGVSLLLFSLIPSFVYLRMAGWSVVLLVIAVTFAADTAALYGGRALGRHKLAPRVSPGKTWEGLMCGLAAGAVAAVIIRAWIWTSLSWAAILSAAFVLIIVGVGGDLSESWLKRQAGVKDSGTILRGMGGVLDRIDALIFAAIAAAIMLAAGWL